MHADEVVVDQCSDECTREGHHDRAYPEQRFVGEGTPLLGVLKSGPFRIHALPVHDHGDGQLSRTVPIYKVVRARADSAENFRRLVDALGESGCTP